MTDVLAVSDLMKITGEGRRQIQHWADLGIIKAQAGTDRGGPGIHRRFAKEEAIYALLAGELNRRKMPASEILQITDGIRQTMRARSLEVGRPTDLRLAEAIYSKICLKWALHSKYPVILVVQRQPNGVSKLLLHPVGANPGPIRFGGDDVPIPAHWFTERLERKLIDDRFGLTAADIIRLDRMLAPARHLFPGKES